MNVVVLVNRAAGGMRPDSHAQLEAALREQGVAHPHIVEFDRTNGEHQLRHLAARRPDFLIVWGGDGTHRSALNIIGREPNNLVLLPGGTRNLLSRFLHGESDWKIVLARVLEAPRPRIAAAGQVGKERFFCALVAGAPALFADAREGLRNGEILRAADGAGRGLWAVDNMHLRVSVEDGTKAPTALPLTSIAGVLVGGLSSTTGMEVFAANQAGVASGLDVIWSSFQTGFRDIPNVSIAPADACVINNPSGDEIPTIVDGEPLHAGSQYAVTFVEAGAHCLCAA